MVWNTPYDFTPGVAPTAAQLDAGVRDCLKAIGDPWTSYTPVWSSTGTAVSIGNGTRVGAYVAAGKLIHFRAKITMGSTSTYGTGQYRVSLPVGMHASDPGRFIVVLVDASASATYRGITYNVVTTTAPIAVDNGTAGGAVAAVAPTVPFTFANGDSIEVVGTYEAA